MICKEALVVEQEIGQQNDCLITHASAKNVATCDKNAFLEHYTFILLKWIRLHPLCRWLAPDIVS